MMTKVFLNDIRWDYLSKEGFLWLKEYPNGTIVGETVKQSSKRRVVRLEGMYLKEVHYCGSAALLKTIGRGTACKEGRLSRKIAERGIEVPDVIGYGRAFTGGILRRDVLLTREVARGRKLSDFIHRDFPHLAFIEKRKFLRHLATYIRKIHDAGVLHPDLHFDNILIAPGESELRFVLLDNDRVSLKNGEISAHQRAVNLALILSIPRYYLNRTQYLRFLKGYGIWPGREGRDCLAALERRTVSHINRNCNGKAHRCLSTNSRFTKEYRHGFTIYRKNELRSKNLVDALLPDPDRLLEQGDIFKAGRTVRAARITIDGQSYFLKRYNCKGFIYRLRNAFRRSRAVRAWLASWGFTVRGIPVPEPIACLEERHWRLLGRSYILSAFVQDAEKLNHFWPRLGARGQKELLAKLGILLGRMHRLGCIHGDLKWTNILVSPTGAVLLTDLDGSRVCNRWWPHSAARDLRRFQRDLEGAEIFDSEQDFFLACWRRWSVPLNTDVSCVGLKGFKFIESEDA